MSIKKVYSSFLLPVLEIQFVYIMFILWNIVIKQHLSIYVAYNN